MPDVIIIAKDIERKDQLTIKYRDVRAYSREYGDSLCTPFTKLERALLEYWGGGVTMIIEAPYEGPTCITEVIAKRYPPPSNWEAARIYKGFGLASIPQDQAQDIIDILMVCHNVINDKWDKGHRDPTPISEINLEGLDL